MCCDRALHMIPGNTICPVSGDEPRSDPVGQASGYATLAELMGEDEAIAARHRRIAAASRAEYTAARARAQSGPVPPAQPAQPDTRAQVAVASSAPPSVPGRVAEESAGGRADDPAGSRVPSAPDDHRAPTTRTSRALHWGAAVAGASVVLIVLGVGALALIPDRGDSDPAEVPEVAAGDTQAVTTGSEPTAPTTLDVVEDNGTSVKLVWDDPNNGSVPYRLLRTPGITQPLFLGATGITVTGLDPGVRTCFQIGLPRRGGGWDTTPEACVGVDKPRSTPSIAPLSRVRVEPLPVPTATPGLPAPPASDTAAAEPAVPSVAGEEVSEPSPPGSGDSSGTSPVPPPTP